jgi:VWFA-related protein
MGPLKSVAIALVLLSPLAFAQTPAAPLTTSAQPQRPAGPRPLHLHVVVTTKDGKPISGLVQSDFSVAIDKQPVPIGSFEAVQSTSPGAAPIETILLVDTVNTRFLSVAYEREQIKNYLRQNNGKLAQPTTLVVLTDTGTTITPSPTRDGNSLATMLDTAEVHLREIGRRQGFYGWIEQFQISTGALQRVAAYEATRPGRKLLVWISPGWPILSGPEVDLSSKQQLGLFHDVVALSDALRNARITLTSVDPLGTADSLSYRTTVYEEFEKGIASPKQVQIGNLALQVLALQSGGRVLSANNDVASLISTATSDTQAFYTLTVTPAPAEHPNQYRSVHVTLSRPGLTAHTLTGYYDQP